MEAYRLMCVLWIKFEQFKDAKKFLMKVLFVVNYLDVDLVWSDPEEIDTWTVSPRGAGWLFGHKVTTEV